MRLKPDLKPQKNKVYVWCCIHKFGVWCVYIRVYLGQDNFTVKNIFAV